MNEQIFRLVLMEDVQDFLKTLPQNAKEKIYYNIQKIRYGIRDIELFKKLEHTEIWEFRTQYNRTAYRLFAFWDKDSETLVVVTHGIIKKTQKTPSKEITKAEELRKKYYKNKNK